PFPRSFLTGRGSRAFALTKYKSHGYHQNLATQDKALAITHSTESAKNQGLPSWALIQVDPAPVFGPALHARARRPGDAGFVDVLAEGGVGLVAVVNDEVEAESLLVARKANLVEGDGGLDAVAVGGATRD